MIPFKVNAIKIAFTLKNNSALNEGYAGKAKFTGNIKKDLEAYKDPFTALMVNPTNHEAVEFFNELGVDGKELTDVVNEQHRNCSQQGNEKRDFVHECAIFAIMSEHTGAKGLGEDGTELAEKLNTDKNIPFIKRKFGISGVSEDVDALIGYKGDVYSGSMGMDDKKSDVAAYNIYYRMRKSNNGDIWESMMVYNEGVSEGSINGSEEFLAHFGNGDPVQGMEELKKELNRETNGTRLLSKDATSQEIEKAKKEFLDYVSDESGVKWE